ncbi:MAG: DUF6452 family protein [Muribaculaceae bacterium]|nr:DUF6452 family protein [Muribaculaceae bacterium]
MNKSLNILLLFAIAFSIISCTSECLDNKNSIGLAGFYSASTKKSITIDSITVYGKDAPGDTMILENQQNVTQVYLPMRLNTSSVQFVLHYEQKLISSPLLNDTVTMNYEAIPYFASEECGSMYWYKINDFVYTEHIVDSVAIPSMMITNADVETIKIFLRTEITQTDD